MGACEKCWSDAGKRWRSNGFEKGKEVYYSEILKERKDTPCDKYEQRFGNHKSRGKNS